MGALTNDLLLRAARRERTERTPVWLMRQAGRTDPAYVRLRERDGRPLEEVFRDADAAAEISLLPKRLGVDAIIIFQDILTPLAAMGAPFAFRPGPVLESCVRRPVDVDALRLFDPATELAFVADTLRIVREALASELPVLGFAGAPLTLAFFLIEGKSPGAAPVRTRAMMAHNPKTFHRLLDRLADMTSAYLAFQIESGADAVQLFESMADLVTPTEYEEFALPYHVKIFDQLARRVPTILFAKEHPDVERLARSGADVLSLGASVDLSSAKRSVGDRVALQGNVDHHLVASGSPEEIEAAVKACVVAGDRQGHILNLSHGLLRETPMENIERFVSACKAIASETTAG